MDQRTDIGPLEPDSGSDFIAVYHNDLRAEIARILGGDEQAYTEGIASLGREWLEACRRGNPVTVEIFITGGMDVNYQDPRIGETALHSAAGTKARAAIRRILRLDNVDYLLRDAKGRLASEIAYLFGEDVALARLLGNKERKQAAAQGIVLTRRL